ncbi:ammonia-forming cytochrome c nitrite reductase subunit c552 [Corallincola holothuriorum]|uniref:nitrite reductase (cytochrome; ammonia-forming) n=1 Tax=Corallincola holothuriorum TaxID=2282215 RepID=A0A368NM91_9GAMM|nr:cytochrome c3 family protein [Corallincola holothuriorum]RCU51528.1 ammonia-forming cytochrome c nitrite reductase subunit c552 [Corallincola holothuriorum]
MAVKKLAWSSWIAMSIAAAAYLGYVMFASADKELLLIGEASHGHYQIELACSSCHGDGFSSEKDLQNACISCHGEELEVANDSHPVSKFTDPRNADRLEKLDARFCVTCHVEHQQERTGEMGVTLPGDFCYECHQDIAEERPTHQGMGFDTCASAGCHNYHDNKALYEDFLVKHAAAPWLEQGASLPLLSGDAKIAALAALDMQQATDDDATPEAHQSLAVTPPTPDFPQEWQVEGQLIADWHGSAHGNGQVNCAGCHQDSQENWIEQPGMAQCASCHEAQTTAFTQGKHGMRMDPRLNASLTPMQPNMARQPMQEDAGHLTLTCNSCHSPHQFNIQQAAVESCLGCHADEHSQSYEGSPHAQSWLAEQAGTAAEGTGVSCASCHLPRITIGDEVIANHNQNDNLRPNEKMLRSVCMSCHSLSFSLDALADPQLIKNNFNGQPAVHIESVDMAVGRLEK